MQDAYLVHGMVMHKRLRPTAHCFRYPVFAIRVRLSALERLNGFCLGVNRWRPLSLRTRDYGPRDGSPLLPWIRRQLADIGLCDQGDVWLQTFPRVFGYAFNPVSFWYCHDTAGQLIAVLADVNNTFGGHHGYLLSKPDGSPIQSGETLVCRKVLHVSPFCKVEGHYRFRLAEKPDRMLMRIDYHDAAGELINTSLSGTLQPLTSARALLALLRQPFLTVGIVWRILWQAFRLWRKHVPFFGKFPPSGSTLGHGQEG